MQNKKAIIERIEEERALLEQNIFALESLMGRAEVEEFSTIQWSLMAEQVEFMNRYGGTLDMRVKELTQAEQG